MLDFGLGPGSLRQLYSLLPSNTSLFESSQQVYPWSIYEVPSLIIPLAQEQLLCFACLLAYVCMYVIVELLSLV